MPRTVTVAHLASIPVEIQLSWPPVFLFVTWFLADSFFPRLFPRQSFASYWSLGIVASCLLFSSLLAHEFGHAYVARRRGLAVYRVSLFLLGGMVEIDFEGCSADDELWLALAGPAVSLALGLGFGVAWLAARSGGLDLTAVLVYLAFSNILLATFNMLPGLPLDGGRVLRAALWRLTGSHARATDWTHGLGQILGGVGVLGGIVWAFNGSFVGGFWLVAVGIFLVGTGWHGYTQASR